MMSSHYKDTNIRERCKHPGAKLSKTHFLFLIHLKQIYTVVIGEDGHLRSLRSLVDTDTDVFHTTSTQNIDFFTSSISRLICDKASKFIFHFDEKERLKRRFYL